MRTYLLGRTGEGLPLWGHEFKAPQIKSKVLILGGVHGDEPEGVVASQALLAQLQGHYPYKLHLQLLPVLNPYGLWTLTRTNGRKVDLNRNLPTPDWSPHTNNPKYPPGASACSEAENKALVDLLQKFQPNLVITLHSWKPMLNTNGPCHDVAQVIAQHTSYTIQDDIGYPTPGSLGTYCTQVLKIPCLTYEIEKNLSFDRVVAVHVPALSKALEFLSL